MGSLQVPIENYQNLQDVFQLAEYCHFDKEHALQVRNFSLQLFDELKNEHHLGENERTLLEKAAVLHDIGWVEGWRGHHKASLRIILSSPLIKINNKERLMIGSIARYHRKALPGKKHGHFAVLDEKSQRAIAYLAAILRIADALDHSHNQWISKLDCKNKKNKLRLICHTKRDYNSEYQSLDEKKDLFEKIFKKKIQFAWEVERNISLKK